MLMGGKREDKDWKKGGRERGGREREEERGGRDGGGREERERGWEVYQNGQVVPNMQG